MSLEQHLINLAREIHNISLGKPEGSISTQQLRYQQPVCHQVERHLWSQEQWTLATILIASNRSQCGGKSKI